MDSTTLLVIFGWFWMLFGLLHLGVSAAGLFGNISEWRSGAIFIPVLTSLSAPALLTTGALFAGLHQATPWMLRISFSAVAILWVIFIANWRRFVSFPLPLRFIAVIALALSIIGMTVAFGTTLVSAAKLSAIKSTSVIGWNMAALTWPRAGSLLFALGAGLFLLLFIADVRRGGSPRIESHWGGIGGGLGGWRLSRSLSYLLVAACCAVVFCAFIFQFEARPESVRETAKATATQPTNAVADPKPDVKKPVT
jgi:hypothetical protein